MPLPSFNKALRSFESGGVRKLDALLDSVEAELSAGVAPIDLMRALDQYESANPLPKAIRSALLRRIREFVLATGADDDTVVVNAEGGYKAAAAPYSPTDLSGYVVAARYRLQELIGEGGMSRIYKATDLRAPVGGADETVALKLFVRHLADPRIGYPAIAADFKMLQGLSHPNIVRFFDCGLDKETLFIAMEYLPGTTLYEKMHGAAEDQLMPEQRLDVIEKLSDALQYAHGLSIVHGDLKPGNILISAGSLKIIDFSIAGLTAPTMPVALTPRYASPQLLSRQRTEPTDDVYSLASIAYEMLTGWHPRAGANAAQGVPFPPPPSNQLTAGQYTAIVHALEPERARRSVSVGQFRQEWAAITIPDEKPRRSQRYSWLALLIVALAVGLYAGLTHRQQPQNLPLPQTAAVRVAPSAASAPAENSTIRDCENCPVMKVLPAGTLLQGAKADDAEASGLEKPQHLVTIAQPFALAENAVTVEEFEKFIAATNRKMDGCDVYDGTWHVDAQASWRQPGFKQTPLHPVVCVSWNDAVAYADWLSKMAGHHYRLPSNAEWEYAARAGQGAAAPWGADMGRACRSANVADESAKRVYSSWTVFACEDGFVNTAPVASFSANPFGLYDMLGNVFAWNEDCWHGDYAGAPSDGSARLQANCTEHELRGGSWFSAPAYIRASYRNHFAGDYRGSSVGIRMVRELTP